MRKKISGNNDVFYLIEIIDAIIELEHESRKKSVMLKRDETQPIRNEPREFHLRTEENDRIFPLETVELQSFKTKHDIDLDEAIIHIGPYADELANSMNALAVTIGMDIFFRNGSYTTATEHGRAVLSHELTHVGQYKKKRIENDKNIAQMEKEAEYEEQIEYGIIDPIIPIRVGDRIFRIRKSNIREIEEKTAEKLTSWLEGEKYIMEPEQYLLLLTRMSNYEGQRA